MGRGTKRLKTTDLKQSYSWNFHLKYLQWAKCLNQSEFLGFRLAIFLRYR